jgi:hypothetical protein
VNVAAALLAIPLPARHLLQGLDERLVARFTIHFHGFRFHRSAFIVRRDREQSTCPKIKFLKFAF